MKGVLVGIGGVGKTALLTLLHCLGRGEDHHPIQTVLAIDASGSIASDIPHIHAIANIKPGPSDELRIVSLDPSDDDALANVLEHPDRLFRMTADQFEVFVGKVYKKLGYEVYLTKRSRDGGVDLYLEKNINGMVHRYIVQCKHTVKRRRRIGVAVARELLGAMADWVATAAILVTNALFSRDLLALAKRHAHHLFCIDRNSILSLIGQALAV